MVNDRFIELLTKRLSDELSSTELTEFTYLLNNDEAFKEQYNFFKSYWVQDQEQYYNSNAMFENIKNNITINEQQKEEEEVVVENWPKYKQLSFILKSVAAMLFVLMGCTAIFYSLSNNSDDNKTASLDLTKTPSRVKSKITLSDGSVVTLNSETTLKYPPAFKGKNREVYLNGEAFFDVAKDHSHPFIVHTGKMSIKVLGTAFNIKSYKNDLTSETTLIRGAIEVTLTDRPSDRIILKPNEKLILNSTPVKKRLHKQLAVGKHSDSATSYALTNLTYFKSNDTTIVETSWVNNRLVFKDTQFKNLANQMERWYGIKVKFKNADAEDYYFTGVFEKESVEQAFKALKMIEPFTYKLKNGTVYIY
jgi:transmembrane sensor